MKRFEKIEGANCVTLGAIILNGGMSSFTFAFLAVLLAVTLLRWGLAWRQIRTVSRHRAAVPELFEGAVSLASHQRAADYTCAKARLAEVHAILEGALAAALIPGGGIALLLKAWEGWLGPGLGSDVGLVVSVAVIAGILELPLSLYRTFVIEARFGYNRMTVRIFLADLAKGAVVGALLGMPLLAAVLWLMAEGGHAWWIYAWGAWAGFNVLILAAYPRWIAPLFNKFAPLQDAALQSRVEALLARCGANFNGIFVMDGSRRSAHGNAYFTGFGRNKRIVLFDTLLERLDPAELEAVLAHELGHYRLRHVGKRLAMLLGVSLALFWSLQALREYPRLLESLALPIPVSDGAVLAAFFLAAPLLLFPVQPLLSWYSRRHEFEADAYASRQAGFDPLCQALRKLYQDNGATLTPDPIHSAFYDSHPPAIRRVGRLTSPAAGAS